MQQIRHNLCTLYLRTFSNTLLSDQYWTQKFTILCRLDTNYSDYTVCFFPFQHFHLSFFVPAIISLGCHGEGRRLISLPLSVSPHLLPLIFNSFHCYPVYVLSHSVSFRYSYMFFHEQTGRTEIRFIIYISFSVHPLSYIFIQENLKFPRPLTPEMRGYIPSFQDYLEMPAQSVRAVPCCSGQKLSPQQAVEAVEAYRAVHYNAFIVAFLCFVILS